MPFLSTKGKVVNIILLFIWLTMLFGTINNLVKVSAIPILLGLTLLNSILLSLYEGIQFDFDKKKYRVFNSFWFIKVGKWLPFKHFDKIVISYTTTKTNTRRTIALENFFAAKLCFFAKKRKDYIIIHKSKNKQEIIQSASLFAKKLDVEIFDQASTELRKDELRHSTLFP